MRQKEVSFLFYLPFRQVRVRRDGRTVGLQVPGQPGPHDEILVGVGLRDPYQRDSDMFLQLGGGAVLQTRGSTELARIPGTDSCSISSNVFCNVNSVTESSLASEVSWPPSGAASSSIVPGESPFPFV